MSTTGRIDWSACPFVTVYAPTCAYCGSPDFASVRSTGNGDGSRTKQAICQSCGEAYKICVEIPESGNVTWPLSDTEG